MFLSYNIVRQWVKGGEFCPSTPCEVGEVSGILSCLQLVFPPVPHLAPSQIQSQIRSRPVGAGVPRKSPSSKSMSPAAGKGPRPTSGKLKKQAPPTTSIVYTLNAVRL